MPGSTLSSAPLGITVPAPRLPGDRLPEASLCLPTASLASPPTRGFFQHPLALGPHTFSVLGVSEVMDMLSLLDGLGEPDAPVQPTAPRAQGGEQGLSSFIH